MQFVTTAILTKESTRLLLPNSRSRSRKTAAIAKKMTAVSGSLRIRRLIALANHAPVTLMMGSSMVSARENTVLEPNSLVKKVGTHCVTLSLSVPWMTIGTSSKSAPLDAISKKVLRALSAVRADELSAVCTTRPVLERNKPRVPKIQTSEAASETNPQFKNT